MSIETIVHISSDFPDSMVAEKTRSVRTLIDGASDYRHVVYSLNRVNALSGFEMVDFAEDRIAVAYGAPPKGILLETALAAVAHHLHQNIVARGLDVSAIHAHKFTVEGLIAIRIARALGVPFVVNIWGDTDLRIVSVRRDLRARWAAIAKGASSIIVCAPWTIDKFDALVALDRTKTVVLPSIIFHEHFRPSAPCGNNRFVTLFNFDAYRRKNFAALVDAIMTIARSRPDIRLDVFGSGSPKTLLAISRLIRKAGATQHVMLRGKISNDDFSATLNRYVAFLMPTRRETFGMVFIEAIFAGLPVLHSKGWGIHGSFGSAQIGYACQPDDQADIVRGIETLIRDEAAIKASIAHLESAGGLDLFKRDAILAAYQGLLKRTIEATAAV